MQARKEYPLVLPLLDVVSAGGSGTSGTVKFWISNPSALLACKFSVAFEPTVGGTAVDTFTNGTPKWTATVQRKSREGGKQVPLHAIFTTQTLPQEYVVTGAECEILVSCDLYTVLNATAGALTGVWVAHVVWEPAIPLCPEDVELAFNECSARVTSKPSTPLALA